MTKMILKAFDGFPQKTISAVMIANNPRKYKN